MLKIKPFGKKIRISVDTPTAGSLDFGSKMASVEMGVIEDVGDLVEGLKKGDKIAFKSWAVDIVNIDGIDYHFIDLTTLGVCGLIK